MSVDIEKSGRSKYQDWVYKTVSCCNGCSNDCIYCFAKGDPVHQKHRLTLEDWKKGEVRPHDLKKRYKKFDTPVMFPGTHDITYDNFEACRKVLLNLLTIGNRILIVSKPRFELISQICKEIEKYKEKVLFRFTIGSKNDDILSFWEPGAPSYNERKDSLKYAYDNGFRTSISIEPMLDAEHIEELVDDLSSFVNHSIWIGVMNHTWYFDTEEKEIKMKPGPEKDKREQTLKDRVIANRSYIGEEKVKRLAEEKERILKGQENESLKGIYDKLKDKKLMNNGQPLVSWKWHIRKELGLPQPDKPEQWIED